MQVIRDRGLFDCKTSYLPPDRCKGWTWGLVTIDIASLSDKAERINITLPSRVLRRIDQAAKAAGESRSGYIARRALG